jgi:hypothetical protein
MLYFQAQASSAVDRLHHHKLLRRISYDAGFIRNSLSPGGFAQTSIYVFTRSKFVAARVDDFK